MIRSSPSAWIHAVGVLLAAVIGWSPLVAATQEVRPVRVFWSFDARPLHAGIPTCNECDLPDSAEAAVDLIVERAKACGSGPGFLWARSILKPPAWYAEVSRRVADRPTEAPVEVVDPYTFFGLIRLEFSPRTGQ